VARGNFTRGADRPKHVGFQPGHPPYYRGGSVQGHAPTNTTDLAHLNGPDGAARRAHNDPSTPAYAYRFDQPKGQVNQKKGGGRPKDRERQCVEALQNGCDEEDLCARFAPRLVKRLAALLDVSENPEHRDFLHAQRLIREILAHQRGERETELAEAAAARDVIELHQGVVHAALPGGVESEPPQAGVPGAAHVGGDAASSSGTPVHASAIGVPATPNSTR